MAASSSFSLLVGDGRGSILRSGLLPGSARFQYQIQQASWQCRAYTQNHEAGMAAQGAPIQSGPVVNPPPPGGYAPPPRPNNAPPPVGAPNSNVPMTNPGAPPGNAQGFNNPRQGFNNAPPRQGFNNAPPRPGFNNAPPRPGFNNRDTYRAPPREVAPPPRPGLPGVNKILACRVVERKMQYLIEWKPDQNRPNTWEPVESVSTEAENSYMSPWWNAVCGSDEKKLEELLADKNRDVNAIESTQKTALLLAAGIGMASMVKRLVEAGADINWQDRDGWTPLHLAAGYIHPRAVQTLLQLGANTQLRNSKGRTVSDTVLHMVKTIPLQEHPMLRKGLHNVAKQLGVPTPSDFLGAWTNYEFF